MENFVCASPEWDSVRRRLTAHRRARCRQRGIRETDVALVIEFGDAFHAGSGDVAYFVGWRAAKRARRLAGVDIEHLRNTAVILLPDGTVRTTIRQGSPRRFWKPAGRRARLGRSRWKGGRSWR